MKGLFQSLFIILLIICPSYCEKINIDTIIDFKLDKNKLVSYELSNDEYELSNYPTFYLYYRFTEVVYITITYNDLPVIVNKIENDSEFFLDNYHDLYSTENTHIILIKILRSKLFNQETKSYISFFTTEEKESFQFA